MTEESQELFVGIDLHKRRWHVPVTSETVKPLTSSAIWAEEFKLFTINHARPRNSFVPAAAGCRCIFGISKWHD